jgi:hypothetical protein
VETEIIRRDYDGKHLAEASTTNEMKISLVRQQERHLHRGQREGLLPQPRIKRLLTLARNDGYLSHAALRRIEIERERCGPIYGPYDGIITNPDLIRLLKQKFGADFVHSASGLSVYGNCPYRFFAQRVLRLEPRGEAALDLQAIDAGKLLHDILRRFFEKHRREPLHKLDRKKLQTELATIADRVFDEHERVVPPLNKQIWKIDREIRKILLDQVLLYELEIQEAAEREGMLPALFEVAFGGMKSAAKDPDSKDEPLELKRETLIGEEAIKIQVVHGFEPRRHSFRTESSTSDLSRSTRKTDSSGSSGRGRRLLRDSRRAGPAQQRSVSREPARLPATARQELDLF